MWNIIIFGLFFINCLTWIYRGLDLQVWGGEMPTKDQIIITWYAIGAFCFFVGCMAVQLNNERAKNKDAE